MADKVLRKRGVGVRPGASVTRVPTGGLLLDAGEFVPTRSRVRCAGVRPDPSASGLGPAVERGRLLVEPPLHASGRPEVSARGGAAAVPDLTRPGAFTPTTAQHADENHDTRKTHDTEEKHAEAGPVHRRTRRPSTAVAG
ncbi:hypothetical protein ACQPZG_06850 [Streptomyces sp. CA-294286]|uniref:hypothetical protein n=1 Tax=Streptomyces sp. CA-294286 TaxID=3240070 RepID=UPI003D945A15